MPAQLAMEYGLKELAKVLLPDLSVKLDETRKKNILYKLDFYGRTSLC